MTQATPPEDWLAYLAWRAEQTRRTCRYLFRRCGLSRGILVDVGCGAGHAAAPYAALHPGLRVIGVEIDPVILSRAPDELGAVVGDACRLPLAEASVDAVMFHFTLMWLAPDKALREVRRVLKPGGHLLCCAEPDYGGMIHEPDPGVDRSMSSRLMRGIERVGGDPLCGRRLTGLVGDNGLRILEVGSVARPRHYPPDDADAAEKLERIFAFRTLFHPRSGPQWRRRVRSALKAGGYFEYLPVFYLLARRD